MEICWRSDADRLFHVRQDLHIYILFKISNSRTLKFFHPLPDNSTHGPQLHLIRLLITLEPFTVQKPQITPVKSDEDAAWACGFLWNPDSLDTHCIQCIRRPTAQVTIRFTSNKHIYKCEVHYVYEHLQFQIS